MPGEASESTHAVLPGAEPWSAPGGRAGALCSHGFTGNPASMRGLATALHDAGFAIELPRLPGHGTSIDDLFARVWDDWTAEISAAYRRLAERCDRVVAVGQSMGGTLALWAALEHRGVVAVACVNPVVQPLADETLALVREMVAGGETTIAGIGADLADPDATEIAYADTPLVPLLSLMEGVRGVEHRLGELTCPLLVITSDNDHVVDPIQSDVLAGAVGGPVERMRLTRSFHVATLDYERAEVEARIVEFARKVTAS